MPGTLQSWFRLSGAHFVGDFAVAGDDAGDVELQGFVESFGPFDDAAAGVAAAEVEGANFLAAEEDAHLLIKNAVGGGHAGLFVGLFVAEDAVAGVEGGEDVGSGEVFGVAAGMVGR